MINYWEYLVPNIVINYVILQHIGNICLFFVSVNIVIKLFARFLKKKIIIVINYREYLVLGENLVSNIVINYVITTYWEYSFFFLGGGGLV